MPFLVWLAQTGSPTTPADPQGGSGLGSLVFFALIIGAFYFLMIRPQRRARQQHMEMVSAIQIGDEVETAGGMYGRVMRATDDLIWVEIVPGADPVKMSRHAIRRRVLGGEPPAEG